VRGADLHDYVVGTGDVVAGRRVRELGLPRTALVAVIVRDEEALPPRGRTQIAADDRLYVLVRADDRGRVEDLFSTWEDGPLPVQLRAVEGEPSA
jgi:cell volume regulation protein A